MFITVYLAVVREGPMQATDVIRDIVTVLSSPAWGGVSSIAALASIPLSIFFARQSQQPAKNSPALAVPKKSYQMSLS
jgi:hypothetical protein